jgi:hypothetical protein
MEEGQLNDLFKEHALIRPPHIDQKDIPTRRHRVLIDSRDRNISKYPNMSRYTITLDEDIHDVINVRLLLTDFTFNVMNVHTNNNKLYINDEIYEIPIGVYNGVDLANMLQNTIPNMHVEYNNVTCKLKFTGTESLTFKFKSNEEKKLTHEEYTSKYPENCIGSVLGFGIDNYEYVANTDYITPFSVNLNTDNYIIMYMKKAKVYVSANHNAHQSFCIINKNNDCNGYEQFSEGVSKSFNPPIPVFRNLEFKFVDYYGNLYDFQNVNHRFEIVFTCLKQTRCYNEIFKT